MIKPVPVVLALCLLAACQSKEDAPTAGPTEAYAGIAETETIRFTGTEPFWGGQIASGTATYSTPETIDGVAFPVERFAGNNGVSFTGTMTGALAGTRFDLMVTPGECSDGMSDRTYPFTASLLVGEERRNGCAWTDSKGFAGPANP